MCLALSTAWNSFRCNRARDLLSEIREVGFNSVELGFSLTSSMVEGIAPFVDNDKIKVVSLHNYCPIPDGLRKEEALPDFYSMSSLDEYVRQKAIKYSKITIDTADRFNAKAVVLHCGRVDIPDKTRELATIFKCGLKNTNEYKSLRDEILKGRSRVYKSYLDNALRSLEELNSYAEKKDILLGIENRIYICEIPSFEEIEIILNNFRDSNIFYWHDTGHAQVIENLGIIKHRDYLERFSNNMIGVHLHNCLGTVDHRAPSNGEIDFEILNPYITKETLKVIEVHALTSVQDLKTSKKSLELIFNGKL